MKNLFHFLIALIFTGISFSFTSNSSNDFAGVYGVSDADNSKIELRLNADMTFDYQDFSNIENKINVSGEWTLVKNHVELHAIENSIGFHNKWKVEKDGNAIKSRKGMCFYRLIKKN